MQNLLVELKISQQCTNITSFLSNSDQNKEKEFHLLNTMLGKQVDGIVFMGEDITDIHVEEFKKVSSTNRISSVI